MRSQQKQIRYASRWPPCSLVTVVALMLLVTIPSWPQSKPANSAVPEPASQVIAVPHGPNALEQQAKHYVVLVSLDGFRYDYPQKHGARRILDIAAQGASAPEGMIPAYPSVTFPNHYTLVTGLYPEHHGIVANQFYDPARKLSYSFQDPLSNPDGSWYGGVPLWSLAEQQGMRTACFFWPGSEAEIAGQRPSFYLRFDPKFPDEARIEQVIGWLKLPPEQRPHFITLYYGNTDEAGHRFGPDSQQTADAVHHVDELMGRLADGLKALQLPVDLFIVADHGMTAGQGDWINLDRYADLSNFVISGGQIYPQTDADAERAFQQLKGKNDKFLVFRRNEMPAELHDSENPRSGDPVVVPTGPYYVRPRGGAGTKSIGLHGFDPYRMKDMRALFVAVGPDIRAGVTVAPFENVNVYPLIAKILGLRIRAIDGRPDVLQGIRQASAAR
jgi:alkaline phosphatase D